MEFLGAWVVVGAPRASCLGGCWDSLLEKPTRIGEIVICPAVAAVNAQHHNESITVELARYLVHGLLHMSGYDDKISAERGKMKREEDRLLRRLLNNG